MRKSEADHAIRNVFQNADFENLLLETGFTMPLSQLKIDDKDNIISSIKDYHCVIKPKAAMDQFIEGLDHGGVLDSIKRFMQLMKPLFTPGHSYIVLCL